MSEDIDFEQLNKVQYGRCIDFEQLNKVQYGRCREPLMDGSKCGLPNAAGYVVCKEHFPAKEEKPLQAIAAETIATPIGKRENAAKSCWHLLPEKAVESLVAVLTYGARKYAPRNWELGLSYMDTVACLRRHVTRWVQGEDIDAESGCHHMAHAAFNCLALVEFYYTRKGIDDRPYKSVSVADGSTVAPE